jgi:hypothetical protein
LPSWWSEAGSAGWNTGVWLGTGPPWVLAGHAIGGWSLEEPGRAPQGLPFPGVAAMHTPLVWYDSVSVSLGEGAAWRGFGGTLATAVGNGSRPSAPGGHAVVDLRSGQFEFDENALSIERGDSSTWFRGEAVSGSRGKVESLDLLGRHLWGVSGGVQKRRHRLEGCFAQRGASATLVAGEEQAAGDESGALRYGYRSGAFEAAFTAERGHDHHQGLIDGIPSRRDASEVRAAAEAKHATDQQDWGVRLEWRRAHVARTEFEPPSEVFDQRASSVWGAARYERPIGEGRVLVELGAGHHSAFGGLDFAPAVSYRFHARSLAARIGFERVLDPVWSDLDPETEPFLQRTWAGVFEVDAGEREARRARATFLFGRTYDRAVVRRLPLEELWLRLGILRDAGPYDFALLSLSGRWEMGRASLGADGFALAHDPSTIEPCVDPGYGLRSWLAWRHSAFQGDLGISLRVDLEAVGGRESQGGMPGLCGDLETLPPRALPGYLTAGAGATLTLADAVVTVRVRNLEDRPREQTWIDCSTFSEALGPGREWRFAVTVRLSN